MRISTSQIYSQSLTFMNQALNDVTTLNMMSASQKRINVPSDDPTGMAKVLELKTYKQSLSSYSDNCNIAKNTLSIADQALSQASENITAASELAEQGATETYTKEQLKMMAIEMESYFDSLLAIANTQSGSDSIFAGDDLGDDAYKYGLGVTIPNHSLDHTDFAGLSGAVESTVHVRFDDSGSIGTDELDYSYSTDNGETWKSGTLATGDCIIDIGTAKVELAAGTAVTQADGKGAGTEFYLRKAALYTGSEEALNISISDNTNVDMSTSGSSIFGGVHQTTGQPYREPNLFEIISDCIIYMEMGDHEGVATCIENMKSAHVEVETGAANIGARVQKATYTQQSISSIETLTTASISNEEDADAAQLIVELEQANYVYKAVLSSTADVMSMSILDYI